MSDRPLPDWPATTPPSFRLLVTGGRDFTDAAFVNARLDDVAAKHPRITIIHGACYTSVNADKLAGQWAHEHGHRVEEYPVYHALDGAWPGAGPRRNARMLRSAWPVHGVVAFPGGSGTEDMVKKARATGVKVWEVAP